MTCADGSRMWFQGVSAHAGTLAVRAASLTHLSAANHMHTRGARRQPHPPVGCKLHAHLRHVPLDELPRAHHVVCTHCRCLQLLQPLLVLVLGPAHGARKYMGCACACVQLCVWVCDLVQVSMCTCMWRKCVCLGVFGCMWRKCVCLGVFGCMWGTCVCACVGM